MSARFNRVAVDNINRIEALTERADGGHEIGMHRTTAHPYDSVARGSRKARIEHCRGGTHNRHTELRADSLRSGGKPGTVIRHDEYSFHGEPRGTNRIENGDHIPAVSVRIDPHLRH